MTVEDPRLAQIRALCDDAGYAGLPSNLVAQIRAVLDAAPVDATPPQGIDRDALGALLDREGDLYDVDLGPLGPKILALVRPVEGVVLTPEEAAWLVQWLRTPWVSPGDEERGEALAARLEAAQ